MTTAAALLFGAAPASAQETEPPTVPTETTAPPSTTPPVETPPSSETPTQPTQPSEPSQPTQPSTPTEPSKPSETPATPEKPAEQPKLEQEQKKADLKVTAAFDKAEYEAGVDFGITVTVANVGAVPAQDIRFATETNTIWLRTGHEQLGSRPTLGPGEQKTIKLTAAAKSSSNSVVDLSARAYLDGIADPTPNNNESRASARVIQRTGTVSGVLYADRNGNGKADAGEGVANTYISGEGGSPRGYLSARTDENGRFASYPVNAGKYALRLDTPKLTPKPGVVVVEEGKNTSVELAVIETTMDSLKPVVELDRNIYGKDDPISVKVTLTNTGKAPLTGVVALCDTGGPDYYLRGDGPGWAPLNPDGPGLSIAAGETKVVTVTDVVPEAAYLQGQLGVACNFGNNGRNPFGTVGASDWAVVEGAFGIVQGKVVNQDDGSAVASARIIGLDPVTRRPVPGAATNADATGEWRMYGVRKGDLVLTAAGPWKLADGSTGLPVKVIGGGEVTADLVVVPGPVVPDPTVHKPDLALTAVFDKPSYDVYDQIQLKVKIANIGTGFPSWSGYLQVDHLDNRLDFDDSQLAPLRGMTQGLWPGESREATLVGTVSPYSPKDTVAFKANISTGDDSNPANNSVDVSSKVTYGVGDAVVTVYGDRNDNGAQDAGEELAGRKISVFGGRPYKSVEGSTDAAGKVAFRGLSAGGYEVSQDIAHDDEWVPESSQYVRTTVNNGVETQVAVRMVRPLSHTVEASLQFGKSSYRPGEQVSLFVTVQNNGDKPVQVKAACYGEVPAYYLTNDNVRWGKWIFDGEGYEVEPHRTVSLYVEQPMPAVAPDHGLVGVACSFGTDPMAWGNPRADAKAKVPGATWTTSGSVLTSGAEEKGVGGTKVVLLDPDTNKPVARTTTDAQGAFTFPDLPVGHYTPVVVGPWKVVSHRQGPLFGVVKGDPNPVNVYVEPGPNVADPDTGDLVVVPPPHGGNPPLGKVKGGGLATTGVSVVGLTAFGLLLVMAGAALRGRRRPVIA
ncbi:hypothetical protein FKR81_15390 [Lentzea tibetensis]|uniref:Alpha-amylase n=1 Tax=Lentzea tibetensis TaxID=2591470 RepID=A0A563EWR9_9PSEU|nr:carboxypeptidase-like regulatory domain-containing protein [Lentzea tibetensis]TWP51574.1 hypothetical protein FKR81_15390 [Lentzea tibetensis]